MIVGVLCVFTPPLDVDHFKPIYVFVGNKAELAATLMKEQMEDNPRYKNCIITIDKTKIVNN